MAPKLYIASIEPRSGKSVVALGVMEMLSRHVRKIGFFRPIVPDGDVDNNIELISKRYNLDIPYEDMFAYRHTDAQKLSTRGRDSELQKNILARYKHLEKRCQFVLCEGTDYTGVSSAFEFDINADIANNLGCPILVVINGRNKSPARMVAAVGAARESFLEKGCVLIATIVNRVDREQVKAVKTLLAEANFGKDPVYVLPSEPILGKPTVGEIAETLNGVILQGDEDGLNREITDFKVAAMNLPNFLEHVSDGTLMITPGDRYDVVLGGLATTISETYPNISGLILTGGLSLEPQIVRLIEGIKRKSPAPIVGVKTDTYTTAMDISAVRAVLKPTNDRKIASALGLFESHVDVKELEDRIEVVRSSRRTPIMFEYDLIERAKSDRRHIVLPEGAEERILRASEILIRRGVVDITLLGHTEEIRQKIGTLGLNLEDINIIDPMHTDLKAGYAQTYFELRQHRGMTADRAVDTIANANYFGTMMVFKEQADGMVSGSIHTTGDTIRPAFEIIRTRPDCSIVSSVFLMLLEDRVLVYGDCAVNPNPSSEQLADIAISSSETAQMFGVEPRVAMLSYSTGGSGKGEDVERVRDATRIARERRPDLKIEGPIQYDAAVDAGVARTKLPQSEVAGNATVFIFPDLNTGNNTYKAVQRSSGAVAVGPVLQGLNKPVNDLSRGCTVTDIVNTVAITAIQAQAPTS